LEQQLDIEILCGLIPPGSLVLVVVIDFRVCFQFSYWYQSCSFSALASAATIDSIT
jgi:hypothetical protein